MNLMLINLILALFWVVVAVLLFVFHKGGNQGLIPIPLYILALVLAIYNLVRWWSMRVAAAQRRQGEEMIRKPSLHRAGDDRPPDPNFVFTDSPPPSEPK